MTLLQPPVGHLDDEVHHLAKDIVLVVVRREHHAWCKDGGGTFEVPVYAELHARYKYEPCIAVEMFERAAYVPGERGPHPERGL